MEEEKEGVRLSEEIVAGELFKVELSVEEVKALALIMPRGYGFQAEVRKKEKSHPKKKIPEEVLLAQGEVSLKTKAAVAAVVQPASKKGAQNCEKLPQSIKPCIKILQQLKKHQCAWPFLQPVDAQGLGIPEYRSIIKQPMDFSTIETKLNNGIYLNPNQFHQDVVKIFMNSYTFNEAYEEFINITVELEKYYYRISGEIKPVHEKNVNKTVPLPSRQKKKKKVPSGGFNVDLQPITTEEKRQLAQLIHRLAKEHIKGIRNIVFDGNSDQNEFDLQKLSQKKLKELQRYVRNKMAEMQNNLRSGMMDKSEQQNLDELESQITEQFIDEPLEEDINQVV